MRKNTSWAGTRLVPLQHESSFSAVTRFAWQNILRAKEMKRLLNGKGLTLFGDSFLTPTWLHDCGLHEIAGWTVPNTYERDLQVSFSKCESLFFSHVLKVCPICFSSGFHSCWHQLKLLIHCPIHNCKLVANCEHCGTPFGAYRFSKNLFKEPYHCYSCKAPAAGIAPDLESIHDQREEIALDQSFSAITKWFDGASSELHLLRAIAESTMVNKLNDDDRRRDLLTDIANVLHPMPDDFSHNNQRAEITILAWNIQARNVRDTNFFENRQEILRCSANRSMARTIYAVATRHLQSWVSGLQERSQFEMAFASFPDSGVVGLATLPVATAAFILFRNYFESSPEHVHGKVAASGFCFDRRPPFQLYPYTEREPRLAYFAIYFAVFAALYWRVSRLQATGELAAFRIVDLDGLLTKFLLRSEQRVAGGVIFRTIPGLPLPRVLLCSLEDAKEMVASSAGFHAVYGRFN